MRFLHRLSYFGSSQDHLEILASDKGRLHSQSKIGAARQPKVQAWKIL